MSERVKMTKTIHATALNVFSTGILITGAAKSGKSELALELLHRGHYFIGDDAITVSVTEGNLVATPAATINTQIHIRSIGIIDINRHFNKNPIMAKTQIDLIVHLDNIIDNPPTTIKPEIITVDMLGVCINQWTLYSPSFCNIATKLETLIKQYRISNSAVSSTLLC
jgi:serine kinase of HPr protein (carbohydrate metabolism regulator)